MLTASGVYDKKYQESMVAHIIRSRKLLRYLADGRISPNDFDLPIHKCLVTAAIEVLQTQSEVGDILPLTALLVPLRVMISAKIVLPEEVAGLKNSIENIYSMELAPNYFENGFPEFLAQQRTLRAISRGSIMDLPALQAELSDAISSSKLTGGVTLKPLMNIDVGEAEVPVPCGISSIDQRMHGGLGLKRSMLICGFTGVGKTALAINFALGSALQGFSSRVAQTELPAQEMNLRLYACAARYSYDMLQFGNQEEDILGIDIESESGMSRQDIRRQVAQRTSHIPQRLLDNYGLYDFSDKTCTIQLIADNLHRDQDANPENPPMSLDVDWLECIDLPPSKSREKQIQSIPVRELRHKLEKTSELFTQLCVRENIAGRMYTQSDFAAEDKAVVKMSNKSEGKGASRRYSWFLGIGATRKDLEENVLTITAGKSRNGRLFSCQIRRALHEQRFEDMAAQEEWQEIDAALQTMETDQFSPSLR